MAPIMQSLPSETLHEICKYLPSTSDVANFRLVCRLFGEVGLASLLPVLPFKIKPESLDQLKEVAAHPILRHNVHTLKYFTDVMPARATPLHNNQQQREGDANAPPEPPIEAFMPLFGIEVPVVEQHGTPHGGIPNIEEARVQVLRDSRIVFQPFGTPLPRPDSPGFLPRPAPQATANGTQAQQHTGSFPDVENVVNFLANATALTFVPPRTPQPSQAPQAGQALQAGQFPRARPDFQTGQPSQADLVQWAHQPPWARGTPIARQRPLAGQTPQSSQAPQAGQAPQVGQVPQVRPDFQTDQPSQADPGQWAQQAPWARGTPLTRQRPQAGQAPQVHQTPQPRPAPQARPASQPCPAHQAPERPQTSHEEREKKRKEKQITYEGEEKVLRTLIDDQEFMTAIKNLTKLKHLHITRSRNPNIRATSRSIMGIPMRIDRVPPFPSFVAMTERLFKPFQAALDIAASEQTQITSLRIDNIDYEFFVCHETALDGPGFTNLQSLHLEVSFKAGAAYGSHMLDPVTNLMRVPVGQKIGDMVCQLPNLKHIKILFVDLTPGQAAVSTSKILPAGQTWPGLCSLELSGVEVDATAFLDFLAAHSETLTFLSLSTCGLNVKAPLPSVHHLAQPKADQPYRWSHVFLPLTTIMSLKTLKLGGVFWETSRPSQIPMDQSVYGMGDVSIGDVVGMLICSRTIDSFFKKRFQGRGQPNPYDAKRKIFKDLLDRKRVSEGRTRYSDPLREFMEQSSGIL